LTLRVVAAIRTLGDEFTVEDVATYAGIPRSVAAGRIQNMVARKQIEAVHQHKNVTVYSIRYLKPSSDPEAALSTLMGNLRYEDYIPKPRWQHLQGNQATHGGGSRRVQPIVS